MKLFHTSPEKIEKINMDGRFGAGLFFSDQPYFMAINDNPITYSYDIDEDEIIDAIAFINLSQDRYRIIQPIVKHVSELLLVSEEFALDLLSENENFIYFFYTLECKINNYTNDEDDVEELEKRERNKLLYNHLSKIYLDLEYDLQYYALKIANALGYLGVKLIDEQGDTYLINMFENEHNLKLHNNDED